MEQPQGGGGGGAGAGGVQEGGADEGGIRVAGVEVRNRSRANNVNWMLVKLLFLGGRVGCLLVLYVRGLFHLLCREPYISATPGPTKMFLYAKEMADSALKVLFYPLSSYLSPNLSN